MSYRETTFTEFHGVIEAFTQKAILFCAENWVTAEWVPRNTKNGDPIIEIVTHDSDSKEATVKIADWICDKNGWK